MRHYFLLTNPSTGDKIQFIFYWNWMMTVFSLHISATLHLTIFGIWSNNIQSVQYVICVMIVRGLWNIRLAIRYTIWIFAQLCTSRGTFLRINGKTTLGKFDWGVWYVIIFLYVQFWIRLAAVSKRGKKVRTVAFPAVSSVNKSRDTRNCVQNKP